MNFSSEKFTFSFKSRNTFLSNMIRHVINAPLCRSLHYRQQKGDGRSLCFYGETEGRHGELSLREHAEAECRWLKGLWCDLPVTRKSVRYTNAFYHLFFTCLSLYFFSGVISEVNCKDLKGSNQIVQSEKKKTTERAEKKL